MKANRRRSSRTPSMAWPQGPGRRRRRMVHISLALGLVLSGTGAASHPDPAGAISMAGLAAVLPASPAAEPQSSGAASGVDLLVTTEWLAAHLDDPSIRIVDLRRGGEEDYARGHVPGAVHVANDALRDPGNPPTFLPAPAAFEALMARLGISNDTHVIAYDDRGGLYAARLWLVLNAFGHPRVSVLDGHFVKWQKEGRPVTTAPPAIAPARFAARPDRRWVATAEEVRAAIGRPGVRIVDARTQAEREGRDLRGIRRGGIIPGSVGVYWEDTFDPEWKTLKPPEALAELFRTRDVRPEHEVIVYCQVGMRASHDALVLRRLGYERVRVYLGSWEEWGSRDDLPIATLQPGQR
jgi:thiosulfate/3-mercaptopyruvate sulfurtransferase